MIDRLAAFPALASIPREQLQWLLDHGTLETADAGVEIHGADAPLGLLLVLSGRFSVRVMQAGTAREVREVLAGEITGQLPYSRMTAPRGYLVADGRVEYLMIQAQDLKAMTQSCYEFTELCVQAMLARVRVFKSDDKQQEKMAALGRLSAGLAHELNNPSSAALRAARELETVRVRLTAASRSLGASDLSPDALAALRSLETAEPPQSYASLSPIARAEIEDDLIDWLEERGLDVDLAHPLSTRGLTAALLSSAAQAFQAAQLPVVLNQLAIDGHMHELAGEIASAAERIHSLVAAVKKHTHMDHAPTREAVSVAEHLADTVVLMTAKAALKGATIDVRVDGALPLVEASVADLNQVWMQLVDNAIDAVNTSGHIVIHASPSPSGVVIRVVDDGPGIPAELHDRVFDPFFTTKDVGQGRGLGLDIVRTVVASHRGVVELHSAPGHTEFRVSLPAYHA